ncbi:MAG: hypothetical protein ACT6Q3_06700 [Sphingopyxis sp.]|jgi:hypothetical protein
MATIKVRHDQSLSLEQLQLQLQDSENRMGRITTIRIEEDDTVTLQNVLVDPPSPLVLLPKDQDPDDGLEVDLEGSAYVGGDKTDVVIYRGSD